MIDKKHLWKRSNRWWVRIKVPDKVRPILMKRQLTKNLYTSDLQEAIRRKHKVVAMLKEQIYLAEKRIEGTYESLSKETNYFMMLSNQESMQRVMLKLVMIQKRKTMNYCLKTSMKIT